MSPLLPLHQRKKRRMHFSGSHLAAFKVIFTSEDGVMFQIYINAA
jgi:hypothetical protein